MAKAGVLTIDVNAGTAQFLVDMDAANAKLKSFGDGGTQAGIHLVSSMQSSSAAIRLLENPLGNNIRAVERFITLLPGMSNLLQAAFPVVGAVAFASILVRMGSEAVAFFQKIEQAPARIAAAFRGLNEPLTLSNDELALANDRLRANIAKLDGRQPNNVAIALDEARVNADRLADSLDKDLGALQKLLKEQGVGFFQSLLTGSRPTSGDDQGITRLQTQLAAARYAADQNAGKTADPEAKKAAMLAGELEQRRLINEEIGRQNGLIRDAQILQSARDKVTVGMSGELAPTPSDQSEFIRNHQVTVNNLQGASNEVGSRIDNASLEGEQGKKQAAKEASEQAAKLPLAQLANEEAANARGAELAKTNVEKQINASHAIEEARIAALSDPHMREVESAEEEVRVAQERATRIGKINSDLADNQAALIQSRVKYESAGKPADAAAIQEKATGAATAILEDAAQKNLALTNQAAVAKGKASEVTVSAIREEITAEQQYQLEIDRTGMLQSKWADEHRESSDKQHSEDVKSFNESQAKPGALRQRLNPQGSVTIGNQSFTVPPILPPGKTETDIAASQRVHDAGIPTANDKQDQIDNLQRVLQAEKQIGQPLGDQLNLEKQILELKIAQAESAGQNVGNLQLQLSLLQAQQKLQNWSTIGAGTFGAATVDALLQLPQQIGNSLAASIFNAPKKGQSKIGEIGHGLEKTGEQAGQALAGKLLTDALEKLVATVIPQTSAASAQIIAIHANTTAVMANTAAIRTGTGGAGAGAAGGAAGSASAAAASAEQACECSKPKKESFGKSLLGGLLGSIPFIGGALGSLTSGGGGGEDVSSSISYDGDGMASGGPVTRDKITMVHGGEHVLTGDQVAGRAPLPSFLQERLVQQSPQAHFPLSDSTHYASKPLNLFDEGGPVTHDQVAGIHAGEHVLTRDQVAGRAPLPSFLQERLVQQSPQAHFPSTEDYMSTGGSVVSPREGDSYSGNHTFHIYENANARETARQVAAHLKTASPTFSRFAH